MNDFQGFIYNVREGRTGPHLAIIGSSKGFYI